MADKKKIEPEEELSKIALAKLKRREKEEEEGIIRDETKKHYVKDTKKAAKTVKHIKPREAPAKPVTRALSKIYRGTVGSKPPRGSKMIHRGSRATTRDSRATPRGSRATPRASKAIRASRLGEGKAGEATKEAEEIKAHILRESLSWPAEMAADESKELDVLQIEDLALTTAKLKQMRAEMRKKKFIDSMLERGVDGIAELIRTHALPKCKKDKFVAEPFEPTPIAWWQHVTCTFAFNHPMIRSRLERLMGSNLVRLTDREYMLQLHDRILEDYIDSMNKRIAEREARERQREKDLVLKGTIPLDRAPKGLDYHPILLINTYCQKLIDERRAKIKVPKVVIPLYLYLDDTPDPPCDPGLSIRDGHVYRRPEEELCVPPETHVNFSDAEDVENGYMFDATEYEKARKYESPPVRQLAEAQNVEEMYSLADLIIGPLKTMKSAAEGDTDTMSTSATLSAATASAGSAASSNTSSQKSN